MPMLLNLGFHMNVIIVLHIMSFCANNSDMYSRSFVFIHFWQPLCVYSINVACISFCWSTDSHKEQWCESGKFSHLPVMKCGTSSITPQSNISERKRGCALDAPCTPLRRNTLIHIEFCLGKLGSTLENKPPATWKLHVCGGETPVSCRLMEARPCRQKAKASFLYRIEADDF